MIDTRKDAELAAALEQAMQVIALLRTLLAQQGGIDSCIDGEAVVTMRRLYDAREKIVRLASRRSH